jgi:hypothetical protein
MAATECSVQAFLKTVSKLALARPPDVIGCDAGSTDSGPIIWAPGFQKSKKAIKHEPVHHDSLWHPTRHTGLVGSAGTFE